MMLEITQSIRFLGFGLLNDTDRKHTGHHMTKYRVKLTGHNIVSFEHKLSSTIVHINLNRTIIKLYIV